MASENEKRETLADIAAEIRAYGAATNQPPPRHAWVDLADRIEAIDSADAWRRSLYSPVVAPAMREALKAALKFIGNIEIEPYSPLDEDASELRQRIMDALSDPPRQCDVGTAEEQEERYQKLKREHVDRLARCPAVSSSYFFPDSLYWAQMPYEAEEGGAK